MLAGCALMNSRISSSCEPRLTLEESSISTNRSSPTWFALQGDPVRDFGSVATLIHHYVFLADGWHIGAVAGFHSDDQVYRDAIGGRGFLGHSSSCTGPRPGKEIEQSTAYTANLEVIVTPCRQEMMVLAHFTVEAGLFRDLPNALVLSEDERFLLMTEIDLLEHVLVVARRLNHDVVLNDLVVVHFQLS